MKTSHDSPGTKIDDQTQQCPRAKELGNVISPASVRIKTEAKADLLEQ